MSDVIGYILLENDDPNRGISNMEVIDKPHLFFIRFNTVLQSLDVKNRNMRVYKKSAIEKGLQAPEITELIERGKWLGEAGHPITKDIQRIATVDQKCTSHRITKWWLEGNLVMGTVETLDDGLYGTKLAKSILQGVTPSFSLRALAMLEKNKTTSYVNKPPRIITYDEVVLPSHKEAYAVDGSYNNVAKVTNGAIAIEATDLKEYLASRSENLKIVCESFDIDPMSVQILNKNQLSLKKEGKTFVFALESKLSCQIADMWSSFKF